MTAPTSSAVSQAGIAWPTYGFDNAHTLKNFGTTETSANPLLLTDASNSAANPLNSLSSAYFKVFLYFPVPGAGADTYQGVTATLNFTWTITPN